MINYAHLKSQMIQLLDLLRSILYPNVFDAMEEAHSKEELEAAARRQLREILERIYREPAGRKSCWPTQPLKPSAFSASPMSCIS